MAVFGYCRQLADDKSPATLAAQAEAVRAYCAGRGLQLDDLFTDGVGAGGIPWLERPAGERLAARLKEGDQVVVARGELVYTSASDLLAVIQDWRGRGIDLHIVQAEGGSGRFRPGLDTQGPMGQVIATALTVLAGFKKNRRREVARRALLERKCRRVRHTRCPGYGWRWEGPPGEQRRVPDDEERAVIGKIIEWKQAGFSWYSIAAWLLRQRVKTAAGREWSPSRVRRACLAELRRKASIDK
jgi:DNA invertase Pin-like site-specific DNA recombinase